MDAPENADLTLVAILYHEDLDGIASAAVVLEYLDRLEEDVFGVLMPTNYDREPFEELSRYDELYMVDFCVAEEHLERWSSQGVTINVFDHHVGRKEVTQKWGVYADDESAVGITWRCLFRDRLGVPEEDMPMGVALVEDRDLWRWRWSETAAYTAALASFGNDPVTVRRLMFDADRDEDLLAIGERLVAQQDAVIEDALARVHDVVIGGVRFSAVNAGWPISDLADAIGRARPELPVVVYSIYGPDKVRLSLRDNTERGVNVREIAEALGGGGHDQAAGCYVTLQNLSDMVVGESESPA